MKIGGTNAKLTATGGRAAREIIEKKLGQRVVEIETRGKGGAIGGGLDVLHYTSHSFSHFFLGCV